MTEFGNIRVAGLTVYPVKSCGGISLETGVVGRRGFELDRDWLIVDSSGKFITQREIPKMALIDVGIDGLDFNAGYVSGTPYGDTGTEFFLRFSAPSMESLTVSVKASGNREEPGSTRQVKVWDDFCLAIDQGDDAAQWLSRYLGADVRLVRMDKDHVRPVEPRSKIDDPGEVGFADGFPFLLISTESLNELNRRLEQPVLMNRFRPNIVIEGCDSFAEDSWKRIKIGEVEFAVDSPCSRCVITTIDQASAKKSVEPLRTLAKFRQVDGKVMFGQNAVHLGSGVIRCGDQVSILE